MSEKVNVEVVLNDRTYGMKMWGAIADYFSQLSQI
jgi:hypothetical protein